MSLLNAAQLAPHLGLSDTTVRKLCDLGKIPAEIREGRIYRFDLEKVKAHLASQAAKRIAATSSKA